jgi:hypothetical protein
MRVNKRKPKKPRENMDLFTALDGREPSYSTFFILLPSLDARKPANRKISMLLLLLT